MGIFIGLVLSLLALNFLRDSLNRHFYRLFLLLVRNNHLAMLLLALLFLPGVVLHEASHWIMAKILWVKTHDFSLMPTWVEDGSIRFGFVETSRTDRIRSALVALAPLISGVVALHWLAFHHLNLDIAMMGLIRMEGGTFWEGLGSFLNTPDLCLWIYLLFTISNTMLPSHADHKIWFPVGIFFAAIYAMVILISRGSAVSKWLMTLAQGVAETLLKAFGFAVVLDVCLVLPFQLIDRIFVNKKNIAGM